MSTKSLLNIILKVLGLFFFRDFVVLIPQLFSAISFLLNFSEGGAISPWIAIMMSVAIYGYFAYILIIKTDWTIEKLKLDKNFNQEVLTFNIHRSTVLNISNFIVGALLVLNAIPRLLLQIILYVQSQSFKYFEMNPRFDKTSFIINSVEIVIGLLLIGYQRQITNYIELRRKQSNA